MAPLCSGAVGEPTLPCQHTQHQAGAADAEKQLALAVLCSVLSWSDPGPGADSSRAAPACNGLLGTHMKQQLQQLIGNMLPCVHFAAQAVFVHTSTRPGREAGENQSHEGGAAPVLPTMPCVAVEGDVQGAAETNLPLRALPVAHR